ncbi:hypothetical protein CRM22_000745, partial [Opisthorchis felineus]
FISKTWISIAETPPTVFNVDQSISAKSFKTTELPFLKAHRTERTHGESQFHGLR